MIYDTLFAHGRASEPQPQMVDKYEVSDGQAHLHVHAARRPLCHDGQPVTAEDCVASIKRWARATRSARS